MLNFETWSIYGLLPMIVVVIVGIILVTKFAKKILGLFLICFALLIALIVGIVGAVLYNDEIICHYDSENRVLYVEDNHFTNYTFERLYDESEKNNWGAVFKIDENTYVFKASVVLGKEGEL